MGLAVVAIEALCHHNSRSVGLPRRFTAVRRSSPANGPPAAGRHAVRDHRPLGAVHVLGNATGPGSIAYPLAGRRPVPGYD